MNINEVLDYEIHSSRWAKFIFWGWGQKLTGDWFAWKIRRKYERYVASKATQAWLKAVHNIGGSKSEQPH